MWERSKLTKLSESFCCKKCSGESKQVSVEGVDDGYRNRRMNGGKKNAFIDAVFCFCRFGRWIESCRERVAYVTRLLLWGRYIPRVCVAGGQSRLTCYHSVQPTTCTEHWAPPTQQHAHTLAQRGKCGDSLSLILSASFLSPYKLLTACWRSQTVTTLDKHHMYFWVQPQHGFIYLVYRV